MKKAKRKDVADILDNALATYRARIATYGEDAKHRHGEVMKALFPNGYTVTSAIDHSRFSVMNMIVAKLVRYTNNYDKPHQDSIHDAGIYCLLLEELDQDHKHD